MRHSEQIKDQFEIVYRYGYGNYLKEKLKPEYRGGSPQEIAILNTPFSAAKISGEVWEKLPEVSQSVGPAVFDWTIKENHIPNLKTLLVIYQFFNDYAEQQSIEIDEYASFIKSKEWLIEYLVNHIEEVKQLKIEQPVYSFLGRILWEKVVNANSEKERNKYIKYLWVFIAFLTSTGNTIAKDKILSEISKETEDSVNNISDGQTYTTILEIHEKIKQYRILNPITPFQNFQHIAKSAFSHPIFIFSFAVLMVAGVVFFIVGDTSQKESSSVPFFGVTVPFNPDSLVVTNEILDSAEYWFRLGRSTTNDSLRIIYCTKAISFRYDFGMAYYYRAHAKHRMMFLKDALTDYSSAITIMPDTMGPYYYRGLVFSDRGELDNALKDLTKAIELNDTIRPPLYYKRAEVLENLQYYPQAMEDYSYIIQTTHGEYEAYFKRGALKFFLGQHYEALPDADSAIIFKRDFYDAYYLRGTLKYYLFNDTGAIKDFTRTLVAINKLQDNIKDSLLLFEIYYGRGLAYERIVLNKFDLDTSEIYSLNNKPLLGTKVDSINAAFKPALEDFAQAEKYAITEDMKREIKRKKQLSIILRNIE